MKPPFIFIFYFINWVRQVAGDDGYVPALVWTSGEVPGRKTSERTSREKIESESFESHIMGVLGEEKGLIVVLLEQSLEEGDLEWVGEAVEDLFPFDEAVKPRVDVFRSVRSPHRTLLRFSEKGYDWKRLELDGDFEASEGDVWVLEFGERESSRPETMRDRRQIMKEVHRRLAESGKRWVSIYTAKRGKGILSNPQQLGPWYVEGQELRDEPSTAVSVYTDDFTGYTLIARGSIQLCLPSAKNFTLKNLSSYSGATAKIFPNEIDFVIWFLNYTLTFHMSQRSGEWEINGAKLLNGNGDSLRLSPRRKVHLENKCYVRSNEFQSEEKPAVKVKLLTYKFFKLPAHEGSCAKPYKLPLTFLLILLWLAFAATCWNRLVQNFKFSKKSRKVVNISINELMTFNPRAMPCGI